MIYSKPNIEVKNLFVSAASQYSLDDLEALPSCAAGGTGCGDQGDTAGLIVMAFCAVGVNSPDAFNGATVNATFNCIGGGQDSVNLPLQGCSLQTDVFIDECPNGTLVLCSDAVPCSQIEVCESQGGDTNGGPVSLVVSTSHGGVSCQDVGEIGDNGDNGGNGG